MKILVAGGAGYLGSVLVPFLIKEGHQVEVIDLLWFGNYLPSDVKVIKKDVFDCQKEDLNGYEQVIFLSGVSNDPMAEFDPAQNFIANAASPAYLAFIAKQAGVKRFVFGSSCSVYGFAPNELYDEESPTTCQYPYGISKLQAEKGVLQQKDDNFSVILLRKGTISGFSPRMRFDLAVNTMFKDAITKGEITLHDPSVWRPILDIRDAAVAYLKAIQADCRLSGIFNIASENYLVGDMGDLVRQGLEQLAGKPIKIVSQLISGPGLRSYRVSLKRASDYLGFSPQFSVRDIVRDLFEHRDKFGDYQDDRFYNIKVFKQLSQSGNF